jgi:hypothetical protein
LKTVARHRVALLAGLALAAASAGGAASGAPGAGAAPAASAPAAPAILAHLNSAIAWYRSGQSAGAWVARPSDGIYFENERTLAANVVRLAFAAANAEATTAAAAAPAARRPAAGPTDPQLSERAALLRTTETIAERVKELQEKLAAGPPNPSAGARLTAQRSELEGELAFETNLLDAVQKVAATMKGNQSLGAGASLADQIEDLKISIPEVFAPAAAHPSPPTRGNLSQSGGLIAHTTALFELLGDLRAIDLLGRTTVSLRQEAEQLAAPLRNSLREVIRQGGAAAQRANRSDGSDGPAVERDFAALSARFKQIAATTVPLREESLALEQSERNLRDWRASLAQQYHLLVHALLIRGSVVGGAVLALLLLSEGWRRITFRYVREPRRRRQLLLARRIVTGVLLIGVVLLGFVSDFGSIATFAGFITAGVAVALQTVIVSVAAYFFIVGRYGIRIGDRITVGGVTGEVAEIGLVRFYMMELAGSGSDLHSTGRIVMFANAVLFQPTPLYKQIPGTDYLWHEAAVVLAPDCAQADVSARLLAVVHAVYLDYRPSLEQQHDNVERLIDLHLPVPEPAARIRYAEGGPELALRYPVETAQGAAIDARMMERLTAAIQTEPALAPAIKGPVRIHPVPTS